VEIRFALFFLLHFLTKKTCLTQAGKWQELNFNNQWNKKDELQIQTAQRIMPNMFIL